MPTKIQFPWDALKAECLRTIVNQLVQSTGAHYSELRKRQDMITFLNDVEGRGLEEAAKTLLEQVKEAAKQRATSSTKRKAEATEAQPEEEEEGEGGDGYNTRYKGVKRVKVRAATPERRGRKKATASAGAGGPSGKRGPGRPRKSIPTGEGNATPETGISASAVSGPVKRGRGRPRKSDAASASVAPAASAAPRASASAAPVASSSAAPAGETPAKRPRGRPRKNPLPVAATAPASKGKQVFDGVVMEKRVARSAPSATQDDEPGDQDAVGEEDIDDPVLRNGHLDDGTSSLGGSNKENEPMVEEYTPDRDTDAQGEPDPAVMEVQVTTETVQVVDMAQSAVIMPTIPMALAAAASNSVPPPDPAQPTPRNSTPHDRPALQPLS